MPRKCSICVHKQREKIEEALLENQSFRNIAKQFSVSYSALKRHFDNEHIERSLILAKESKEITKADRLIDQLKALKKRAVQILDKAELAEALPTALFAIREIRGIIELYAKVLGQIKSAQVNIQQSVNQQISLFTEVSETKFFLETKHPKVWKELINHLSQIYWRENNRVSAR